MSKWWWGYQHSAAQGPLIPHVIHPDPSTTILLYITRRAWRVVVLQTVRLQDGYSWRTANRVSQGYGERVFVGDSQSRKVSRLYSYPFSEFADAVDRISSTIWLLNKVFLDEGVDVLDGYSWVDHDVVSWTMPEVVGVADAYSRTLRDLIVKTLSEAVGVADDYSVDEASFSAKTMPEAVGVVDDYDAAQVDVSTKMMPEAVGVADDYTSTKVSVMTVTLGEVVKVAEGGVLTPPPDPAYPDKTRYVYILGEKVLTADAISRWESRTLAEGVSVADAISRGESRTLAEGVSVADGITYEVTPVGIPMEYVFTEGTAAPYNVKYDYTDNLGSPVTIATSEYPVATGYTNQRKFVRTSDGTLYAVYLKQLAGQYQIYVKQSADNGATWTDETLISTYAGMNSYAQIFPSIAVDGSDHLHVVWYGIATGYANTQIWYALYDGSWHTPVCISTYAGMSTKIQASPSIAVNSSDHLHVVWQGVATGYSYAQIWYALYDGSWKTPVRISNYAGMDAKDQSTSCIAVDSSDYLHVTWHGLATGYTTHDQIWYRKYTASWGTVTRISTYSGMSTNIQRYSCIAVDSSDHLHVVWYGRATGYTTYYQIWHAEYTNSWQTPVRISTYDGMNTNYQYNASIAVDSDDLLHVVWMGTATGYTDYLKIWYAVYVASWANPVVLQPTGQNQHPNLRWSRWP